MTAQQRRQCGGRSGGMETRLWLLERRRSRLPGLLHAAGAGAADLLFMFHGPNLPLTGID